VVLTKLPLWISLSARKSRKFLFLNILILFLKLPQFTVSTPQLPNLEPAHTGGAGTHFGNQCFRIKPVLWKALSELVLP